MVETSESQAKSGELTLEQIQNFKGKYPKQLWYLALVEMWERFTFYGMRALLALYIATLALSNDYKPMAEADMQKVKTEFQKEYGEELTESHPLYYLQTSQQKYKNEAESKSNKQYGLIQAFIYAMAFVGGMFADKLFGFRKSVFWGGLLMAIGTFVMAIPGAFPFYLGVSVLIVGNGFFKPNISTMVGALYKPGDARKDAGFSVFYMAINVGALLSGLTIAYIGTSISWSLGFASAGVCMLLGLGIFHFTQKKLGPIGLAPEPEKLKKKKFGISKDLLYHIGTLAFIPFFLLMVYYPFDLNLTWLLGQTHNVEGQLVDNYVQFSDVFMILLGIGVLIFLGVTLFKVSKAEKGKLFVAVILILFSVLFFSFFEQGGGSLNFFAMGNVESHGLNMTQVNNSINPMWVIIVAPILAALWIALSKRKKEPNTVVKFGMGFVLLGGGFLVFAISRYFASASGLVPLSFFFGGYLVTTIGELCLSPIGLSMVTTLTPKRLQGVMMGTWFLASAYGQYGAGLIGSMLAKVDKTIAEPTNMDKLMQYTEGYQSIAIIAIIAGVVLLVLSPVLYKIMTKEVK